MGSRTAEHHGAGIRRVGGINPRVMQPQPRHLLNPLALRILRLVLFAAKSLFLLPRFSL